MTTRVRRVDEDVQYEAGLRPRTLDDYIGQERVRANLQVSIAAARQRREALDHVLLYGPPGLGKTTLAYVIGQELGVAVRATAGPVLERPGDLAAILTSLGEHEVLFIDEIHRMSPAIEEVLYPAMEDYELDIIIGQGPGARSIKVPLQKFTLIGATTRAGLLTSPLRSRFGIVHRLDFYNDADLEEIVRRSARILNVPIVDGAAAELARRSRGTPRIANRLLRRVRDFAQVKRGRDDHRAGRRGCAQTARSRRAWLRRGRSKAAEDDHRQVRRRTGRHQQHRGGDQRRERRHRRHLRAVPDSNRISRSHAEREGGHGSGLQLLWIDCARKGFVVKNAGYRPTKISGLATFVPPRLLTNKDLERLVDTSDEWILQRTGIRERHVVDAGVATSDLAKEAALKAIAHAGLTPHDIDFIVVGTTTPDMMFPSTACLVQNKIGADRAWGFDLGAACSGFTYALTTAAHMVAAGTHRHALAIGADVMSSIIDYTDASTCVLFGDGAGAVVVSPSTDDCGIIDFAHEIDGERRPGALHARWRQPPAGIARNRRAAAPLRETGWRHGLQICRAEDRRNLRPRDGAQ